ncbi:hypothetical protein GBA63_07280 [Rubrobacter tropicus]|uniref:Uncharacterized protein n=1 Tax=Rubrobacter tropicus TaxID=2653851 RepID=A0A6G8Q7P8_9ACTN|nr:hypothetical protein [Rubrobacter tropicus]QIN82469.1 hypothetical protein GBA63_07280 [Rubrobacter tropicus]
MSLIRTILGFVILLILVHVALVYVGINSGANTVTRAIYSLGTLLESPAALLINAVPAIQQYLDPTSFFTVAFTAIGLYLILYLLLGVGKKG